MTEKPLTYWSERSEASDQVVRREKQLETARSLIVAGLEMAFLVTGGSGLQAIEVGESAVGAWLAQHNAELAAEVAAVETVGSA